MRLSFAVLIAFGVWAAIFTVQAVYGVGFWIILATWFIFSMPFSNWLAEKVTGINPLRALYR